MKFTLCKSKSAFLRKAKNGQRILVLWPSEALPKKGWEKEPGNRREGKLQLSRGMRELTKVVFEDGSSVELPPRDFWIGED